MVGCQKNEIMNVESTMNFNNKKKRYVSRRKKKNNENRCYFCLYLNNIKGQNEIAIILIRNQIYSTSLFLRV